MKKRSCVFTVLVLMLMLCCSFAVSAADEWYLSGTDSGSADTEIYSERVETVSFRTFSGTNGIAISNASQLAAFRDRVNAGENDLNAYLTCDIDLKSIEWEPIGTQGNPYTGTFDGNGNCIWNLNSNSDYAGLFGGTDGACITSLGVAGVVIGDSVAGGIVAGSKDSYIMKCYNYCDVRGGSCAGGIAGIIKATDNNDAIISSCYNAGDISSINANSTCFVGGITGLISSGEVTILFNYNLGVINCPDGPSGGIAGAIGDHGFIASVYNLGSPDNAASFGEIVGFATGNGGIANSYFVNNGYDAIYLDESSYEHSIYYVNDASVLKKPDFVDRLNDGEGYFIFDEFDVNGGFPLLYWEMINVTGVQLNRTSAELAIGDSIQLNATVSPVNATVPDITWKTSNSSVATVTDGNVKALNPGTAKITATTLDGGYVATCVVTVKTNAPVFTDVPAGIWYYDSVYDLVGRGIVNGMTETSFAPNDNITRAQFAKILAAASGENTGRYDGKEVFTDCKGHWADEYINWAFDKGIVKGMSATEFAPNEKITREQMAAMICRYASYKGVDLPKINARLTFKDDSSIGGWAKDNVYAMQQAGIINGYADGSGYVFKPAGYATRAEAAKMISAFLNL